jgi:ParB-like chromosome segregation protein Spo0J
VTASRTSRTTKAPEWPADRVERWPLDRLIPYARNARTHSDEQVAQIAASIREWGWTNPVLVDEDGGIIAGHGRVLAARVLALAEAPVMVARGWTKAQKQAYLLADNKLALNAGWDDKALSLEIMDLDGMGFDLALVGFNPDELSDLLGKREDGGGREPGGLGEAIVQYNIVFDDDTQQQVWFALLRKLRQDYPDLETIGARLAAFIAATA